MSVGGGVLPRATPAREQVSDPRPIEHASPVSLTSSTVSAPPRPHSRSLRTVAITAAGLVIGAAMSALAPPADQQVADTETIVINSVDDQASATGPDGTRARRQTSGFPATGRRVVQPGLDEVRQLPRASRRS